MSGNTDQAAHDMKIYVGSYIVLNHMQPLAFGTKYHYKISTWNTYKMSISIPTYEIPLVTMFLYRYNYNC